MSLLVAIAALLVSAPAADAAAAAPADPDQKIICRRQVETGSLVKARKVCHTRAEWQNLDDQHQAMARGLADDNRSRISGN